MKKNVKRINESQLRAIVAESVKRTLREMKEGVITIGSPEDGEGCHVTIALDSLGPYAEFDIYGVGTDGQAAVDAAVDYLDKQGETGYFWDDEEQAQEYPDDFFTAGNYCHQLRRDLVDIEPIGGLNESALNEYQFGDFTKRIGAGASTMLGKGNGDISKRWANTKKNWQTQGDINGLNELLKKLQQFVDAKQLNPNSTIAELIGNKWMMKGYKQGIKQRIGGLKGNVKQRGGQWR